MLVPRRSVADSRTRVWTLLTLLLVPAMLHERPPDQETRTHRRLFRPIYPTAVPSRFEPSPSYNADALYYASCNASVMACCSVIACPAAHPASNAVASRVAPVAALCLFTSSR